jgi:cyclase
MTMIRLIPRLDIKGPNLIKSIQLEGLRVIGDPGVFAKKYYDGGADELIYMDTVASLYGRNSLKNLISKAVEDVFIPITVGGGIRTVDDAREILRSGADKIAINTAAVNRPEIIKELVKEFGSQSMVISIEAKIISKNKWEVFIENGRQKTDLDVIDWAKKAEDFGIGEILLTSIDREGTRKGFDIELIKKVQEVISIPLIVSGGMGSPKDLIETVKQTGVKAVSMADAIHYNRYSLKEIKNAAISANIEVRNLI